MRGSYRDRLPAREFLRHLSRQSIPELADEDCLAALGHIEAQYGDAQCFVAGMEVRLGSAARTLDYSLCTTDDSLFPGAVVWLELDYEAYARQGRMSPCLFLNTWDAAQATNPRQWWRRALVSLVGKCEAERLWDGLFGLLEKLPEGACIKQIGVMARPHEAGNLRMVIQFPRWPEMPLTLEALRWRGNAQTLTAALGPYEDMDRMAACVDLNSSGMREKLGIEIYPRWRHPVLVDRMVSRLEASGLCRSDKGQALRRWVRIAPDADPFIQPVISHYKLAYADGAIVAAKAYLEQSLIPKHGFFPRGKELLEGWHHES